MPIRQGIDPQLRENFAFQTLHSLRFSVAFVVMAEEMQEPVHDEVLNVMERWDAALPRFPADGLGRQHKVSQVSIASYRRRAGPGKETTARWWVHPCRDRWN